MQDVSFALVLDKSLYILKEIVASRCLFLFFFFFNNTKVVTTLYLIHTEILWHLAL